MHGFQAKYKINRITSITWFKHSNFVTNSSLPTGLRYYISTWYEPLMSATNKNRARQLSEVTYIFSNIRLALIHVKCAGDFISTTTWPIKERWFHHRQVLGCSVCVYKALVLDVFNILRNPAELKTSSSSLARLDREKLIIPRWHYR